jgi:hypothetical protein
VSQTREGDVLALHLLGCIYITETIYETGYETGYQTGSEVVPPPSGGVPAVGDVTLYDRQLYGFDAAVLSIEHATVLDSAQVGGDWDLLFGNDPEERLDRFTVRMKPEDAASFIVDLGDLESLAQIPQTIEAGQGDEIEAIEDHVYLVRTDDQDTRQYAMVLVTDHVADDHVDLHWCRSLEPDRFVPPPGCCE